MEKESARPSLRLSLPTGLRARQDDVDKYLLRHARDAAHWLKILEESVPPEEVKELEVLGKGWQPYGGAHYGIYACLAIAALNREDKSVERVLQNILHSGTLRGILLEPKAPSPLAAAC